MWDPDKGEYVNPGHIPGSQLLKEWTPFKDVESYTDDLRDPNLWKTAVNEMVGFKVPNVGGPGFYADLAWSGGMIFELKGPAENLGIGAGEAVIDGWRAGKVGKELKAADEAMDPSLKRFVMASMVDPEEGILELPEVFALEVLSKTREGIPYQTVAKSMPPEVRRTSR